MMDDSVAKFIHRNSAYLLGSKCILFIVCGYLICLFDRVSPILTSLALTILHYYTNQAIESIHPQRNILWHFRVSLIDSGIPSLIVLRILICFGGDGEICTPVLPNFLITSTNLYSITWYLYNGKAPIHLYQVPYEFW